MIDFNTLKFSIPRFDFSVHDLPLPRFSMNPAYCGGRCKTCRSNDPSKNQVSSAIFEVPQTKEVLYSVRTFVIKRKVKKTKNRKKKKNVSKNRKGEVMDKDKKTNRKKKKNVSKNKKGEVRDKDKKTNRKKKKKVLKNIEKQKKVKDKKTNRNKNFSVYKELVKIYEKSLSSAVRRHNSANAAALSNATDLQNQQTTVTDSGTTTTTTMIEQEIVTTAPAASQVESLTSSTTGASGASTAPAVVPVSELATVLLVASPRITKTTATTDVANQMSPQITAEKNFTQNSQIQAKRHPTRLEQRFFIKHNYVENLDAKNKLVLKLYHDNFTFTIMTPLGTKTITWPFVHVQDDHDKEAVPLIEEELRIDILKSVDREEIPHYFFDILDNVGEDPVNYVYKFHVVLQIEMYAAEDELPVFSCFLLLKPTKSTCTAFSSLYQAKNNEAYLSKMSMPLYLDALDKGFSDIDKYGNIYGNAFVSRMRTINFSLKEILGLSDEEMEEFEEKLKSNIDDLKSYIIETPLESFQNLGDESPSYKFKDVAEELELYLKMKINYRISEYITKNKITVTILNVIDPAHFVVKSPELSEKPFAPKAKSFSEAEEDMNKFYDSVKLCNSWLLFEDSIIDKFYEEKNDDSKVIKPYIFFNTISVVFYEGKFYRGKVIEILTESDGHLLFKIYLVDYGIECSVTRDCIYKTEEDFLVHPFQAVNFKLLGMEPIMDPTDLTMSYKPVSYWDPSSEIFVRDLIEGKKNAFIEVQGIEGENIYGKLYVTDENMTTKCVNDELISNSFAYENEDCFEKRGFWEIFTPGSDSCWSTTEVMKLVEVFHFHVYMEEIPETEKWRNKFVKDKTDYCKIFVFLKEEVYYTVLKYFDTSILNKDMNRKLMLTELFCNRNRDELDRYIFEVAKVLSNAFNTSLSIEHEISLDNNTHIKSRFKFEDRIENYMSKFNLFEEKEPVDSEDLDEENTEMCEKGTQKFSDISEAEDSSDDMESSQERTKVSDYSNNVPKEGGENPPPVLPHIENISDEEMELDPSEENEMKKTSDDERNIMLEIYKVSLTPEENLISTAENYLTDKESEFPSMMTKSEELNTNFEEEGAESSIRNDLTFEGKETEYILEAHPFEKENEYIFEEHLSLYKCSESEEDQESSKKQTVFYPSLNSEFSLEDHDDIDVSKVYDIQRLQDLEIFS